MKREHCLIVSLLSAALLGAAPQTGLCAAGAETTMHPAATTMETPATTTASETKAVTVRLEGVGDRRVSDRLLGFNIVYAKNPDSLWRSGELVRGIRAVHPGFLRYPGGTVNTYFHWENPTGNGWEDAWDPQYDASRNRPPEEYMDIDEYIALVRKTGAEPLVGININSGFRWNRVEEGIDEALRLMKYCRDKGLRVKYWYMGNEPYMHDCNGGAVSPARYGEMINAFVPRMKAFDPEIKIIANWHATFRKHGGQYDELLSVAGRNIDVIDVHWYCMWGTASWNEWLAKTPCGVFTGDSYASEIGRFREIAERNGYPDLKLASLEWNVGPGKRTAGPPLKADQSALVQAEMMIQFMQGGLDMATFWPLFWDSDFNARSFFDKKSEKLLPTSEIQKIFGTFQGAELVDCALTPAQDRMLCVAVRDRRGAIRVCLLNKNGHDVTTTLAGPLAGDRIWVETFRMTDDLQRLEHLPMRKASGGAISLAPYSLTFLTVR